VKYLVALFGLIGIFLYVKSQILSLTRGIFESLSTD